MEAKELRIGNWVKESGISSRKNTTDPYQCELSDMNYYPFLEAIPLTEEWLLKFGFYSGFTGISEFSMDVNKSKHDLNAIDTFRIYNSCDLWHPEILSITDISEPNDFLALNAVRYVHQLQNLYFALTGEELTINQTKQ
jgi:hypothetical protein